MVIFASYRQADSLLAFGGWSDARGQPPNRKINSADVPSSVCARVHPTDVAIRFFPHKQFLFLPTTDFVGTCAAGDELTIWRQVIQQTLLAPIALRQPRAAIRGSCVGNPPGPFRQHRPMLFPGLLAFGGSGDCPMAEGKDSGFQFAAFDFKHGSPSRVIAEREPMQAFVAPPQTFLVERFSRRGAGGNQSAAERHWLKQTQTGRGRAG